MSILRGWRIPASSKVSVPLPAQNRIIDLQIVSSDPTRRTLNASQIGSAWQSRVLTHAACYTGTNVPRMHMVCTLLQKWRLADASAVLIVFAAQCVLEINAFGLLANRSLHTVKVASHSVYVKQNIWIIIGINEHNRDVVFQWHSPFPVTDAVQGVRLCSDGVWFLYQCGMRLSFWHPYLWWLWHLESNRSKKTIVPIVVHILSGIHLQPPGMCARWLLISYLGCKDTVTLCIVLTLLSILYSIFGLCRYRNTALSLHSLVSNIPIVAKLNVRFHF